VRLILDEALLEPNHIKYPLADFIIGCGFFCVLFVEKLIMRLNKRREQVNYYISILQVHQKGKGSPYSITERRVPELIPILGSQPAGDVSHKPGGRLPLLSARPAVTLATLKRAATSFAAW